MERNFSKKDFGIIFFYILLLFPFFIPDILNYKFHNFVTLFRILQIFVIIIILIIYMKRFKISKILKYLIIYLGFLFLVTLIKNGDIYYNLKNSCTIFGLCLLCEYLVTTDSKRFIKALLIYLSVLILVNFVTIILFPEGMYLNNSGMYNNWFLGYKNSHILYILPCLVLMVMDSLITKDKIAFKCYILTIICLFMMIYLNSSTSIICLFVFLVYIIFYKKLYNLKFVTAKRILLIIFLLFLGIVIFRLQDLFSFIFVDILGKSITFTGRTYIWDFALDLIKKSSFIGYGDNAFYYNKYILSTHNQFLGVTYETGIAGLSIYLLLLKSLVDKLDQYKPNKINVFFKYIVLIYLLIMLMEEHNMRHYMYLFVIIYNYCELYKNGNKDDIGG